VDGHKLTVLLEFRADYWPSDAVDNGRYTFVSNFNNGDGTDSTDAYLLSIGINGDGEHIAQAAVLGQSLSRAIVTSVLEEHFTDFDPDIWHSIAFTYDGGAVLLYFDGVEIGSEPFSEDINATPGIPLSIGNLYGNSVHNLYVDGTIDEVRIYERALSPHEVRQLHLGGGLVAHYPLDGDVSDVSGNGSDGTVYGDNWSPAEDRYGNADGAYELLGGTHVAFDLDTSEDSTWTWTFWFRDSSTGSEYRRWLATATGDTAADDVTIREDHDGIIYLYAGPRGAYAYASEGNAERWKDGQWHFFSVVSDGVNTTVHMDANEILRVEESIDPGSGFFLGGYFRNREYAVGTFDDIRVYDYALTGSQMRAIYEHQPISEVVAEATGRLPDTGQTKCYGNFGEITCPQPGEPFRGQDSNYTINPRGYTKLDAQGSELPYSADAWVMVRDDVTGLIWEVKTDDGSVHDKDNTYTWCDANPQTNGGDTGTCGNGTDTEDFIEALNASNYGGFSDWRLPLRRELRSIVAFDHTRPSINTESFPDTRIAYYWSANTRQGAAGRAWAVGFTYGEIVPSSKSTGYHVRAVRGNQVREGDLVDNGDETVSDTTTGLMWQQATAANMMDWQNALSYCEDLSHAGYTDWRLPNHLESDSLADLTRQDPAVNTDFFPDTYSWNYWSSTTYPYQGDHAYHMYFQNGGDNLNRKSGYNFHTRCVRGGQIRQTGSLLIASPLQASRWSVGEPMPITWDTQDITGSVKILLSRDGGETYTAISESTENDGRYNHTLTGPGSVNCMLRVEPASDPGKGTTQGLFTIEAISPIGWTPDFSSSTHTVGLSSPSTSVTVSWSAMTPGGGATADSYTYVWDSASNTAIDTTKTPAETISGNLAGLTVTRSLGEGTWYFHSRAVDSDENWTDTKHFGPIIIDAAPVPSVLQVEPSTGANNSESINLALTGASFRMTDGSDFESVIVRIGAVSLTNVTVSSATSLTATYAIENRTAGSYDVIVTTDYGSSEPLGEGFTVTNPAPTAISVSPNSAGNTADISVTIVGTGFLSTSTTPPAAANPTVQMRDPNNANNDFYLTNVTVVSTTSITATVPSGKTAVTYDLVVTNGDGQSATKSDTFQVTSVVEDVTDPTPPTGATADPPKEAWTNDNTIQVTWTAGTDTESGVAGYSYEWDQNASTAPDKTVDITGTSTTSPVLGDGIDRFFHVRTVDNAGNGSTTVHLGPFLIDATPPANGSLSVNGGADSTGTIEVVLTLSATDDGSGMGQMRFSNDNVSWSNPVSYATPAPWSLFPGDGTQTVYAQFSDSLGNWTTVTISDDIEVIYPPPPPTNLKATATAAGFVVLEWDQIIDPYNVNYTVFRSEFPEGVGVFYRINNRQIDFRSASQGKVMFLDDTVQENRTYYYKVRTLLGNTESTGFSNTEEVTPYSTYDFDLGISDLSKIVNVGGSVTYKISLEKREGFQGDINLFCTSQSGGFSYEFLLNGQNVGSSLSGLNIPAVVELAISTGSSTLPGDYVFSISAKNVWEGGSSDWRERDIRLRVIGKYANGITLTLDKTEIGKGEEAVIAGAIYPPLADETVELTIVNKETLDEISQTVSTSTGGVYEDPVWLASLGIGNYRVVAAWMDQGSEMHEAEADLSIYMGSAAITCRNESSEDPEVGKDFAIIVGLMPPLAGERIILKLGDPDGNWDDLQPIYTDTNGKYRLQDSFFTKKGRWQFKAYWEGNAEYVGGESEILKVPVEADFGRAIIIGGGEYYDDNTYWETTKTLVTKAYGKFQEKGFTDDMIYLMIHSETEYIDYKRTPQPIIDDYTPTPARFVDAIENYFPDRSDLDETMTLYIYMQGHATPDGRLKVLGDSDADYIHAQEIGAAINSLQARVNCTVVVILEACYSGNFIDYLKGPNRILLTSAGDEIYNTDDTGINTFTHFLFDQLITGDDFRKSFLVAQKEMSNRFDLQPQMDDNGDGTSDTLDGTFAADRYLEGLLKWGLKAVIAQDVILPAVISGADSAFMSVKVIPGDSPVERVWVQIISPDADIRGGNQTVSLPVEELELQANGRYEGTLTGLNRHGTYKVNVLAEDEAYEISDPLMLYLSVSGEALPGDVNGDDTIDLADAILSLKVACGMDMSGETIMPSADVNGDNKIGLAEMLYVLQNAVGLRD